MRLHRLVLTAFGPFAGTEVVDFDALSGAGLFLLHGPTGAGKTSLLDAVCYALYGQVPGARAQGRLRLRSDHAPPDREPRVQLELTVGGRRLQVARTPEWSRPKRRGAGVTTQPSSTSVSELVDGAWRVLTTRSDEAGQLLLDLLGMGHEQFTKVVLLPQGHFAAFLRASAEDRRQLLSRLFSIDRFAAVEAWFCEERRRVGALVTTSDQRRALLLSRAAEVFIGLQHSGSPDQVNPSETYLTPEEVKATQRMAALLDRAEVLGRAAQVDLELQTERRNRAQAVLSDAVAAAERHRRWSEATTRLAQLDARSGAHADDERRLAAAHRAEPLGPALGALAVVETAAHEAALVRDCARDAVRRAGVSGGLDDDLDDDLDGEAALRTAVAGHRVELGSLEAAVVRAGQLDELDERAAAYAVRRDDSRRASEDAARQHRSLGEQRDRARLAHAAAVAEASDAGAARSDLAGARQVLEWARGREQTSGELVVARRARDAAVRADDDARRGQQRLWSRRLAGIAGELAAALTAGSPCGVCGCREHPSPASAGPDDVSRAEAVAADQAADEARATRARSEQDVAILSERQTQLAALSRGLDSAVAGTAVDGARTRVQAAERAAEVASRQAQVAESADRAAAAAELVHREQLGEAGRAEAALGVLDSQRQVLRDELDVLRGADADVRSRVRRVSGELSALEALLEAGARAGEAGRAAAARRAECGQQLAHAGFSDADEAQAAVLAPDRLAALAERVEGERRARSVLLATLAEPELADASRPPDVEAARSAVNTADVDLRRALGEATAARGGVKRLAELAREVRDHEHRCAPLLERRARLDELTDCVNGTGGGNTLRMRLSAYVLAARLEEVAAAATERLEQMSDGRYALVHSDERAKGSARSGLGLRVVDSWTGVERDTTTLSGGESFLASLALALGLADVVQAEAGGTAIETLFVDEGFGSLDDETLDEVMGVLDGLRDGGRAVGLVSHVGDLRTRISAQLEVRKSRGGSTLVDPGPHPTSAERPRPA